MLTVLIPIPFAHDGDGDEGNAGFANMTSSLLNRDSWLADKPYKTRTGRVRKPDFYIVKNSVEERFPRPAQNRLSVNQPRSLLSRWFEPLNGVDLPSKFIVNAKN